MPRLRPESIPPHAVPYSLPVDEPLLSGDDEQRRTLLTEAAALVGRRWFDAWRESLKEQGRALEGGWPGTMPEARARVATHLTTTLAGRRLSPPTRDELTAAARATYDEARRAWLCSPARRRGPEA